jgi:hypothetical protein
VQTTGVPPAQTPAWHVLLTVHALPSSQGVPVGAVEQSTTEPHVLDWQVAGGVQSPFPLHDVPQAVPEQAYGPQDCWVMFPEPSQMVAVPPEQLTGVPRGAKANSHTPAVQVFVRHCVLVPGQSLACAHAGLVQPEVSNVQLGLHTSVPPVKPRP